jgi:hypothetical protein
MIKNQTIHCTYIALKTKTTFSNYFFHSVVAQIINRDTQGGLTNRLREIVCCLVFDIY